MTQIVGTPVVGQAPTDEDKEILRLIREAFRAPQEVPEDVLRELRRSYKQPSAGREAEIFRELRRLYYLNPERETAILLEIRKSYDQPTPEQEHRIFREIDKAPLLPEGTIPEYVQSEQAARLFRKLDVDRDSRLHPDEMSDSLRLQRFRHDANRDGFLSLEEYWPYYQARLRWLSEQVALGQIDIGLRRGGPAAPRVPSSSAESRPSTPPAKLPPGLPAWFGQLDEDHDGQVSLYEWRIAGKPLPEFAQMDRNDDGFAIPEEVLRYQATATSSGPGSFTTAADRYLSTLEQKSKKKS